MENSGLEVRRPEYLVPALLLIFISNLGKVMGPLKKLVICTRLRLFPAVSGSGSDSDSGQLYFWIFISRVRQEIDTSLHFAKALYT